MSNENNKTLIDNIRNEIENYWKLSNNLKFNHSNSKIKLHEPTFGPDEVMAIPCHQSLDEAACKHVIDTLDSFMISKGI